MNRREVVLDKVQTRLDGWTDRIRKLLASPECALEADREIFLQHSRELLGRHESAVVKLEELRRAGDDRFTEMQLKLEGAFKELQNAWREAVAEISPSDPSSGYNPT